MFFQSITNNFTNNNTDNAIKKALYFYLILNFVNVVYYTLEDMPSIIFEFSQKSAILIYHVSKISKTIH